MEHRGLGVKRRQKMRRSEKPGLRMRAVGWVLMRRRMGKESRLRHREKNLGVSPLHLRGIVLPRLGVKRGDRTTRRRNGKRRVWMRVAGQVLIGMRMRKRGSGRLVRGRVYGMCSLRVEEGRKNKGVVGGCARLEE